VLTLVLWLAVVLAGFNFLRYTARSALLTAHNFAAFYVSARIVVEGGDLSRTYDDAWFGDQIDELVPGVRDVSHNPPTSALIAVPFADLDYANGRTAWTLVTVALLAVIGAALRALRLAIRSRPAWRSWRCGFSPPGRASAWVTPTSRNWGSWPPRGTPIARNTTRCWAARPRCCCSRV
jgi:hypothetical protein